MESKMEWTIRPTLRAFPVSIIFLVFMSYMMRTINNGDAQIHIIMYAILASILWPNLLHHYIHLGQHLVRPFQITFNLFKKPLALPTQIINAFFPGVHLSDIFKFMNPMAIL